MRYMIAWTGLLISVVLLTELTAQGELVEQNVRYFENGGDAVEGFLVMEEGEQERPGIILIHEWWGLNSNIRETARLFAREGYVALAVDLYNGESTTERARAGELAGRVRGNIEGAFDNLRAALEYLKQQTPADEERLASIGWCFGGGWSYEMAANNLGVRASVIYYGRFNPQDDLEKMRAEIIGHFAENDRGIRIDDVQAFQARLRTTSGHHEIYIYPNTQHGFASRPGENDHFDAEAAELAWRRTLDFLKKYL